MNAHELQDAFGSALAAVTQRRDGDAMRILDDILTKEPKFAPGWLNRGYIQDRNGCQFDAILCFNQALALNPTDAATLNARGLAYAGMGFYEKALKDYDAALEINPSLAEVWNNKGIIFRRQCRTAEALEAFRNSVDRKADYADAHLGVSMCQLELMQFEEGWKEFEWRWKNGSMPERQLPMPKWTGEKAEGKTDALLIYGEQGYGDILQFMRYVTHAKKIWGGPVYFECRHAAVRVAEAVSGVDAVITLGERLPVNIKYQIALMSLPLIVGTEKGFEGPYITPDAYRAGIFAETFKDPRLAGLRVGLCWAGQRRDDVLMSAIDARRSMSLDSFAPLAKIKGVTWVSLQKGGPLAQAKIPPAGMNVVDFNEDLYDFFDTAALIQNLDLVISVDTAVCHLAAGIGKPTWMLSRYDGCWRWFGDRPDSPWYPSLRQFRQKKDGSWDGVVEEVWRELQQFVVQHQTKVAA